MKPLLLLLLLGLMFCLASPVSAAPWYETLRPGATRGEIRKVAGNPTSSADGMDTYKQPQGRIECKYDGHDVLQSAIYFDTSGGGDNTLYGTFGELKETDPKERRAYLKNAKFAVLPKFAGQTVYANKYGVKCYEVDGSYLVIEPIISLMGGSGYFEDKAARVLLVKPDGSEKVLYRAADHWHDLKPPGLADADLQRRTSTLKKQSVQIIGAPIATLLGKEDSNMGSGEDYRLFYLEDALLVVTCDNSKGTIETARIVKPGLGGLTLSEWRAGK